MKKNLLLAIAATGIMYSCGGGASDGELKAAADKICNCVADKTAQRGEISDDLRVSAGTEDYSVCALAIIGDGVDVSSDDFTEAVGKNCPELKQTQMDYAKSLEEQD